MGTPANGPSGSAQRILDRDGHSRQWSERFALRALAIDLGCGRERCVARYV
jgi:hypothetical protein